MDYHQYTIFSIILDNIMKRKCDLFQLENNARISKNKIKIKFTVLAINCNIIENKDLYVEISQRYI